MRSFVTRYGSPETRKEVEHDEDECAACEAAGGIPEGGVIFMLIESEEGRKEFRRIEGLGPVEPGLSVSEEYGTAVLTSEPIPYANGCRRVTVEEIEAELEKARSEGRIPS